MLGPPTSTLSESRLPYEPKYVQPLMAWIELSSIYRRGMDLAWLDSTPCTIFLQPSHDSAYSIKTFVRPRNLSLDDLIPPSELNCRALRSSRAYAPYALAVGRQE